MILYYIYLYINVLIFSDATQSETGFESFVPTDEDNNHHNIRYDCKSLLKTTKNIFLAAEKL